MANEILSIMARQHILIEKMLNSFLFDVKINSDKKSDSFSKFSDETKKHFLIEEQAIINYCMQKQPLMGELFTKIKNDHVEIFAVINGIGKNLSKVAQKEVKILNEFLGVHRDMEEKEVYPVLDNILTLIQKKQIIKRLSAAATNKNN